MIVIIDYGMGNLGSILKSLKYLKVAAKISTKIDDLINAEKLILPGVGHFSKGINNLRQLNYLEILNRKVLIDKTPILGICLGMQLFSNFSEEGNSIGLGWIDAEVKRFNISDKMKYKVPHIGWNSLMHKNDSCLLNNLEPEKLFYFVHSYHLICKNEEDIIAYTNYSYKFVSAVQKGNIFGTQFHPEKSHKQGLEILKNFVEKC